MPKKITKKSKEEQVAIREGFDLSVDSPEQSAAIVLAMQNLLADRGWQFLVQLLEGNVAALQTAVLRKRDLLGKADLTEDECDRLRDKLEVLEELIAKPQSLIDSLTQEAPEEPNYDPYDKGKQPRRSP